MGLSLGTIGNGVREEDELVSQDLVLVFELMKGKRSESRQRLACFTHPGISL